MFLLDDFVCFHRRLDMSLRRRDVEQWMRHRRLPEQLRRYFNIQAIVVIQRGCLNVLKCGLDARQHCLIRNWYCLVLRRHCLALILHFKIYAYLQWRTIYKRWDYFKVKILLKRLTLHYKSNGVERVDELACSFLLYMHTHPCTNCVWSI